MATTTKEAVSVAPFVVEADGRRNNDLLIQNIPGLRLRSRVTANRPVLANPQDPVDRPIGKDMGRHLGALPEIPGMLLQVDPSTRKYRVTDPLYGDDDLCRRIQRALEADERTVSRGGELRGVPPQEGVLGVDEMKTLVREICWLLHAGDARMHKGPRPCSVDKDTGEIDLSDVNELPGDYLLEPNPIAKTSRPRYEKDLPEWERRLNSLD